MTNLLSYEDLLQLDGKNLTPYLISIALYNIGKVDPYLPELAKALAVPKFFDDEIIRLFLHEDAVVTIDETKSMLGRFFCVSQGVHDESRYYFHDLHRNSLLELCKANKENFRKYQEVLRIHYLNKADYFKRQSDGYVFLWRDLEHAIVSEEQQHDKPMA